MFGTSSRRRLRKQQPQRGTGGAGGSNKSDSGTDAGSDTGIVDTGSVDTGAADMGATPDGNRSDAADGSTDTGADAPAPPAMIIPPRQSTLPGARIPKYVDPVPTFNGKRIDGKAAVTVDMVEFQQKILPASVYASLPAPYNAGTYLWGYKMNGGAPSFPAMTIEATKGTATTVTYTNSLAGANGQPLMLQQSIVSDLSIHSADPLGLITKNQCMTEPPLPLACLQFFAAPIPAVPHLHGAEVLSDFDGMPDAWFTPNMAYKGPAYVSNVYTYPNTQEATTLWFHDHALGTTASTSMRVSPASI